MKNKLKGFYIKKSSNIGCWTDLPIRVELDENIYMYKMIAENIVFYILRSRLNNEYKTCPKKIIKQRINYLNEKLRIYEN